MAEQEEFWPYRPRDWGALDLMPVYKIEKYIFLDKSGMAHNSIVTDPINPGSGTVVLDEFITNQHKIEAWVLS